MSFGITAEDMVGICLVLADGNMMLSMEDVILQAEDFQKIKGIHFGVSWDDFRSCLFWLGYESGLYDLNEVGENGEFPEMFQLPLLYWLPLILTYHVVYFNDEGESWSCFSDYPDNRKLVHAFISKTHSLTPDKIMAWLDRLGLNRDSLDRYTEHGDKFDDVNEELPFDRPHYDMYPANCIWSQLGLALQAEKIETQTK